MAVSKGPMQRRRENEIVRQARLKKAKEELEEDDDGEQTDA